MVEFLTVGQAAELLGISPWTLRNWDRAGRLKPRRHPHNGYRIYRRQDLEGLLGPDRQSAPNDRLAPAFDWDDIGSSEHLVQFYESDAYMMDAVAGFMGAALPAGEGAVVIATASHIGGIDRRLAARGFDLTALRQAGQYVALDAAATLAKFMVDGAPDAQRFVETIAPVIARMARAPDGSIRRVRAFGEMVALLWAQENAPAAVKLEEFWNDLGKSHAFALFCAYPMPAFADHDSVDPFRDICACHTRVVPAESYASIPDAERRLREITFLQQKAQSLEAEIARRKQAERALAKRQRELSDFLENATEGLHQVGSDGTILWANAAELRLLGYEPREYIGHSIYEFHVDRDVLENMLDRLARGECLYDQPARMRCKDGSIKHVLVNSNAYFEDGKFIHTRCFTRDVTARYLAEQELLRAKAAAEEASRAKDQFLATLSHELRTPLTPVLMAVAAMEGQAGLTPRQREDLAMVRRNIALETRLIDDLLDLSRVLNGKMALQKQDLALHPLVRNVLEMVASEAHAKKLNVRLELEASDDRLHADSARVHQVLWNLLKNAIKFTPEEGCVTIRSSNQRTNHVAVHVQDTGIGIEPGALATIFNPFDQGEHCGNRTLGGLGLGLAISKAVVEMHGGAIFATSDGHGQGACFSVELPLAAANPSGGAQEQPRPHDARVQAKPLRILLVEDHADTLCMMRRLLEASGHTVTAASSVAQASQAALGASFDLLISDIGLPDGTGIDVIARVRSHHCDLPAIALTGYGMEQDVRECVSAGFAAHLTKPVDYDQLEQAIARQTASARQLTSSSGAPAA